MFVSSFVYLLNFPYKTRVLREIPVPEALDESGRDLGATKRAG